VHHVGFTVLKACHCRIYIIDAFVVVNEQILSFFCTAPEAVVLPQDVLQTCRFIVRTLLRKFTSSTTRQTSIREKGNYWREMSGNFAEKWRLTIPDVGIFDMPQICDMGPTTLLRLRRKARWGFFRPENSDGYGRVRTRKLGYQRPACYPQTTEAAEWRVTPITMRGIVSKKVYEILLLCTLCLFVCLSAYNKPKDFGDTRYPGLYLHFGHTSCFCLKFVLQWHPLCMVTYICLWSHRGRNLNVSCCGKFL
jgi:hypothetical protein